MDLEEAQKEGGKRNLFSYTVASESERKKINKQEEEEEKTPKC
jgi:hypothetical protein